MTLDPKLKADWLEALRSGRFKQAWGQLCNVTGPREEDRSYCCLGVLAEVDPAVERNEPHSCSYVFPDENGNPVRDPDDEDKVLLETDKLPPAYARRIGITWANVSTLIHMNDFDELDFTAIANWIEEHL